ncbi:type II toxin-antitoxin system VapC family toxin [Candidatus Poribacteria bacterium]|nr:type II toxin-antitoxin system VapC family toxin [Candidatus Poribacteria bacterium]
MNAVFADAGYWIALFNPRDQLHTRAIAVSQSTQNRSIVTSQLVLMEFLNYYASLGQMFRQQAVGVVRSLQQDTNVEIVPLSDEQFEAALTLYAQRQDKTWGIIDCASFLIMEERGITEALAYDEHFRQAGFVPLLREN